MPLRPHLLTVKEHVQLPVSGALSVDPIYVDRTNQKFMVCVTDDFETSYTTCIYRPTVYSI